MLFPNAEVAVNPVLLLLLGWMVGTLSGFFGVGGAFLVTGGLLVFGVPPVFAVGTGLTLTMGSSLINTLKHLKFGHVDYKLGCLMVTGAVPTLFAAERLNTALESAGIAGPVIGPLYVMVLAGLGLFIIYDYWRTRGPASNRDGEVSTAGLARRVQSLRVPPHTVKVPGFRPVRTYVSLPVSGVASISVFVPVGVGLGVGFLAGLLGAGGGFILMPLLIFVLGIPTVVAIGTGLFQIVVTGSVGTFIYSWSNHVDLLMAAIMLAAASAGAQFGSTATRFVEADRIRVLYGLAILSSSSAVALELASQIAPSFGFLSTVAAILLLGVSGAICAAIALLVLAKRGKGALPGTPGS